MFDVLSKRSTGHTLEKKIQEACNLLLGRTNTDIKRFLERLKNEKRDESLEEIIYYHQICFKNNDQLVPRATSFFSLINERSITNTKNNFHFKKKFENFATKKMKCFSRLIETSNCPHETFFDPLGKGYLAVCFSVPTDRNNENDLDYPNNSRVWNIKTGSKNFYYSFLYLNIYLLFLINFLFYFIYFLLLF